ncbi:uncharacterized protein PITG_09993 [Phytophthora infestans T30-4]|uniref:Uncharacterized protein n=1 Tax=Phytophthora infestans (strain T30-4) TaxID=403677 RepID=D0NE11_PHYIT|nr:uncharacterized protein PITG_09993 [Phytophthora infestans T30-4]EEY56456.1 hypothetical protein PITG_09993 [Phytophthora infestans T30-4]|eukprot:XP_002902530.1 hypothetical protein PITG_09993 [Phytophthora infestans T30-4]
MGLRQLWWQMLTARNGTNCTLSWYRTSKPANHLAAAHRVVSMRTKAQLDFHQVMETVKWGFKVLTRLGLFNYLVILG